LITSFSERGVRSTEEYEDRKELFDVVKDELLFLDDKGGGLENRLELVVGEDVSLDGVVGEPVLVGDTEDAGDNEEGDTGAIGAVIT